MVFADDDGDDGEIICSELSIWEVALTGNEVLELGGDPTGAVPARSGWWKFDDPSDLLKATIGNPLQTNGVAVEAAGPVEGNGATLVSRYRDLRALSLKLLEQLQPLVEDAKSLPEIPELDTDLLEAIEQPADRDSKRPARSSRGVPST